MFCSYVTVFQNKMQVDQEDQKLQAGDSEDKKAEADEMEVHVHHLNAKFPYFVW